MNCIKRLILFLLIFTTCILLAHTPLLLVEDNCDGTLYAEAGFSDGSGAQGMTCRLEDENAKVLWEGKFDEFNSVEVAIPDCPKYYVVLDAGPGHIVKKEGPVKSAKKVEAPVTEAIAEEAKPAEKPVESTQPTIIQPVVSDMSPVSFYPVRDYSSSNNDLKALKTEMTLITVFLGVMALCLIFITITLIIMVSNKKN
ncbi:MAG TPA: hypothetical protein P5107_10970 [Thermotogota bacterium]|nr:hypothetical protein [Thermotogota bacterium]